MSIKDTEDFSVDACITSIVNQYTYPTAVERIEAGFSNSDDKDWQETIQHFFNTNKLKDGLHFAANLGDVYMFDRLINLMIDNKKDINLMYSRTLGIINNIKHLPYTVPVIVLDDGIVYYICGDNNIFKILSTHDGFAIREGYRYPIVHKTLQYCIKEDNRCIII